MRVAAVQTTAGPDREENLATAADLVTEAADAGAALVVLPELFSVAGSPEHLRGCAEALDGPTTTWAATLAARLGIHLLSGTFPERDGACVYNTSCLVDPAGTVTARYRKIHLFDVQLGKSAVCESATFAPGRHPCVAALAGPPAAEGAVLGVTICYDLRFPELYRALTLGGATVIAVPAAFTAVTGPAHWETLLRARAIENQVYVIGAGQVGRLPPGMPPCHGHSMVVDPWGSVIGVRADDTPGIVVCDLDFARLARIRAELPVLAHRQPDAYVLSDECDDRKPVAVATTRRRDGGGRRSVERT